MPARTQVICVLSKTEYGKTTNTGHLMSRVLENCECRVRGEEAKSLDTSDFSDPSRRTIVLFPSEGARVLDAAFLAEDPRPIRLVVPDATWSQARRITKRVDALRDAQKVVLAPGFETRYRLRRGSREGGVCTYEAITEALCVIEGEHVRAPLEHVFRVFVERTLWSRGELKAADVLGGISREALDWKGVNTWSVWRGGVGEARYARERHRIRTA